MSTVMIVGATRGIGLELAKQYAAEGNTVIACARDSGAAEQLDALSSSSENISIQQLDISDPASIEAASSKIGDGAIDTVIVVSGSRGGGRQSLDDLDIEEGTVRSIPTRLVLLW